MNGDLFPARAEDLPPGVYWYRREKEHGGGAQALGYDLTAARFSQSSGDWMNRRSDTDGTENAHSLVYGLPIRAVADGVVIKAWRNAPENPRPGESHPGRTADPPTIGGGGNHVLIESPDGSQVLYAHMQPGTVPKALCPIEDEFMSGPGDNVLPPGKREQVKAGTWLGKAGNTGASSGPHLHIHRVKSGKAAPFSFEGFWFKSRKLPRDESADWQRATDAPVPSGPTLLLPDYGRGSRLIARHGVAAAEYQFVLEHIAASGYRPVWIDAYDVGGRTFFNLICRPRDGVAWVARHGLTAAAYQAEVDRRADDGWRLAHVESYRNGTSTRYAAIFRRQNGPQWSAYHGLSADQHQSRFEELSAQGLRPINVSVVSAGGGLRYTALYERAEVGSFKLASKLTAAQYQVQTDANRAAGRGLAYLNAYVHDGSPRFSAIWTAAAADGGFLARHGMSSSAYQNEFDEQAGSPRTLRLVTGYEDQGRHRFAALWRH